MVADEEFPQGPVSLPWGTSKGQTGHGRMGDPFALWLLQLYPLFLQRVYSSKEQLYCAKPNFESKLSSCIVICGFRHVLCDLCPTLALILGAVTFCIQLRFPAPHY